MMHLKITSLCFIIYKVTCLTIDERRIAAANSTFAIERGFVLRGQFCGCLEVCIRTSTFVASENPAIANLQNVTSKPNRRHNNEQTDDYKHKMKR